MIYWISWYQPTEDHRPLTYPPNKGVLGWWCTGMSDKGDTLCAMVVADTAVHAEEIIRVDWPEAETWRFCDEVATTTLSDRFPLDSKWMKPRIDAYNESNNM